MGGQTGQVQNAMGGQGANQPLPGGKKPPPGQDPAIQNQIMQAQANARGTGGAGQVGRPGQGFRAMMPGSVKPPQAPGAMPVPGGAVPGSPGAPAPGGAPPLANPAIQQFGGAPPPGYPGGPQTDPQGNPMGVMPQQMGGPWAQMMQSGRMGRGRMAGQAQPWMQQLQGLLGGGMM